MDEVSLDHTLVRLNLKSDLRFIRVKNKFMERIKILKYPIDTKGGVCYPISI